MTVASLVRNTLAVDTLDRRGDALAAVDDERDRLVDVEASILQAQQGPADCLALGGSLPQPQRMLHPGRIHAQRHHDQVIADTDPVDEDRQKVKRRKVAAEDLGRAWPACLP